MQAEVSSFTELAVVSRFKKDYLVITKKGGKVASSVDARVSFHTDRGTFKKSENFVLQVHSKWLVQHLANAILHEINNPI